VTYDNDKAFVAALADPLSRDFLPQWRFWYSAREAEQDAYFWFLTGQKVGLEHRAMDTLVEKAQALIKDLENMGLGGDHQ